MQPLLFLTHRIPFPPNKGDKIRSYHLLRHLSARYRVHLGTFIDDPADAEHIGALDPLCATHCVVPLDKRMATLRSVSGLFTGEPLTNPYYRSRKLQRWIDATVTAQDIRKAVVFSAAMAQYVQRLPQLRVVLDLCDVDSAKWTQYSKRHSWPLSLVYRREGGKLLETERRAAHAAAATVLVTRNEADVFTSLAPEFKGRLQVVEMGVDTNYFAPRSDLPSPYATNESAIVFTGVMDYWPNIDAVSWFAHEVLPKVARQRPDVRLYIVGMNAGRVVRSLAGLRVTVTGKVDDVRPYLQHAAAVVAPLRVARGMQSKILEAMAMGKPVVASTAAAAALSAVPGIDFESAGEDSEFAEKLLHVMHSDVGEPMGKRARERIITGYSWEHNLSAFDKLLEPSEHRVEAARG